ncbi:uncharacterized protein LTR77_000346 [Saxophila tyrrhenica]|uniref:UV-endonuclease UvdE n=1 Tax=Saxophila tyrrhenica TaxID=1690608 RepID=A0AAV9PQ90_9PEZI|nr:hypothetical protein LTR77_000346 [Saxophila tyrrhenica]
MPPKRKRSSVDTAQSRGEMPPPSPPKRRASTRNSASAATVNPDVSGEVIDAPNAARASPSKEINEEIVPSLVKQENGTTGESPLSDAPDVIEAPPKKRGRPKKASVEEQVKGIENAIDTVVQEAADDAAQPKKGKGGKKLVKQEVKQEDTEAQATTSTAAPATAAPKKKKGSNDEPADPEADEDEEADEEEVKEALSRPPPVNSDYLPLPWKGRLGYACLNTYLRMSNPPVFSSRTCRIQSILEHRHPLQDPTQPEHPTKNRPDRNKPADVELGKRYVEALCLANVKDIIKMVRWNDRYGIKFFRLSSEMFPFASHPEYGYKLAPFASEALAEAGKVIAELGHRVTTHPGQFTQLGSPRSSVIDNAVRDLEYHDELLSLLKLPEQQDKDAVMILHMGGVFEGKAETLQRFRENYAKMPQGVKDRLVLENDDVSWTVHDLLPICEELNIPFVLDYHHHNIMFDSSQIREGTADIVELYPRIKATWDRKGITQKMHYSEPTPAAITGRQRRKHNPRVATLPPCAVDMDLMIEAKDKEQAVFELMRIFKLPGYDTFNDVIPYTRNDDNKAADAAAKKKARTKKKAADEEEEQPAQQLIPDDEVGMGGPEGRVYWPPGMEEWLRPKKKEVKKKEPGEKTAAQIKKEKTQAEKLYAAREAEKAGANGVSTAEGADSDVDATPATKKAKAAMKKKEQAKAAKTATATTESAPPKSSAKKTKVKKEAPMPSPPSEESEEPEEPELDDEDDEEPVVPAKRSAAGGRRAGGRKAKQAVSYNEDDAEMDEE